MDIFTITYASLYGGQMYTETKVFKDKEKLIEAYSDYIHGIADNIDDPDESEEFLKNYAIFDWEAHWESWGGEEMYLVVSEAHTIDTKEA